MKNRILFILVLILLFSVNSKVFASELCSSDGYTVLTINGIFTDEDGAIYNKDVLKFKLHGIYNNQPLKVDYVYNPTHIGGASDLIDVLAEGLLNETSDYDLTNMLNDASQKVTTQKLLLVGHSQGNFYANNFYNKVADQSGGVPSQSIGVYSVATPASIVAGGGKYLTSNTDFVINKIAGAILGVLPSNTHISLQKGDDTNGHDFSGVYLKYESDRIVADIKSSLDKLKNNNIQDTQKPCISAPGLTMIHKIKGLAFAVVDPTADVVVGGLVGTYNAGVYLANGIKNVTLALGNSISGLSANVVSSLPDVNSLTTILPLTSNNTGPAKNNSLENIPENQLADDTLTTETLTQAPDAILSTDAVVETVNLNNSEPGIHTTGGAGADAEVKDEITQDKTAPVISLVGDESITINVGETFSDPGATAIDDIDGVVNVVTTGSVDTSTAGTYILTYTAIDSSNNSAEKTRTVNVVALPPALLNTFTIDKDTILPAGEYTYENLVITNNAHVTLEGDPLSSNQFKGVKINAVNITVDSGSTITADVQGYGTGPGIPPVGNYGGASYGGVGLGNIPTSTYGSALEPKDLGSGAVNNYRGGGAILLAIKGSFVNNGTVSANGNISASGGSIYVTADNITGTGTFQSDGGNMYASGYFVGPGSGGRISLHYKSYSFSGKIESIGGCGSYDGWSKSCGAEGTIGLFDTSNNDLYLNYSWKFTQSDMPFSFNNIYISNSAKVTSENNVEINANNIYLDKSSIFTLADNQIINSPIVNIKGNSNLVLSGSEKINSNTLTISGNSYLTVLQEKILALTVPNLNIEAGSYISADTRGYGPSKGPGTSQSVGIGASYGGTAYQGNVISTYGSAIEPVDFGSGGATNGGGAIHLVVTDTFTNNGIVSAVGGPSGSGGSIYVVVNNLSGNGVFQALGGSLFGSGYFVSPGGGGRIALHYIKNLFTGVATAKGGCGSYDGWSMTCASDGTVKLIDDTLPAPSDLKIINTFNLEGLSPSVAGVIDENNKTISLTVPFGTNVTNLLPTITISDKATVSPISNAAQNFYNPVSYTVMAENNSTQSYMATVIVAPDPNPIPVPDTTPPSVTSYTFNGSPSDITINPTSLNPVALVINASENVNWTSIRIEKESDPTFYKIFYSGTDCVNSTNSCTKNWDGVLSKGGLIQNGDVFKVKVKMKDLAGNAYDEYLAPYVIKIDTSI